MSHNMTSRGDKEEQEKAQVFSQWPLVAGMYVCMYVLKRHVDTSTLARFATYWVFFDTY
jgi:hypothetical protein